MASSALRHLTSINDLTVDEIESVFAQAARFLNDLGDPDLDHRIGSSTSIAQGKILATLFYEPSTRTRLSFESAMLRLGGKSISSADPATSSAAKGESLADTVRVVSNYADVLVIRHPRDGAARFAAEYASVPIINGGDGAHEHPTQTLCDLFTLKRENKNLKKINVAIQGDLKGSRTIHSFVYALARFGAQITLMPAKGMNLPDHVFWRLRHEFKRVPDTGAPETADALYVTSDKPHQLALIAEPEIIDTHLRRKAGHKPAKARTQVDAMYVTRFQKERWAEQSQEYPTVDANFPKGRKYSKTSVLHPLPRVGELDVALDDDPRAVYFRQAAYGVPIRMALMSLLLGAHKTNLVKFDGGFRESDYLLYDQPRDTGIRCANANCIVHDAFDGKTAHNKFHLLPGSEPRLRCIYCETDIEDFVFASRKNKTAEARVLPTRNHLADTIFFGSEEAARAAGYATRKRRARA